MSSSSHLVSKSHPSDRPIASTATPHSSCLEWVDGTAGVLVVFLSLIAATWMILGIVEQLWQPFFNHISMFVIVGIWGSTATVVFSLACSRQRSIALLVSAWLLSLACVVAVTGLGWNQWAWGVTFSTNVLVRPVGQTEFTTLTAIGGLSVVVSCLICTVPAIRSRIDRGEPLFFCKPRDYLWLLASMIVANVLAQLDLRSKTPFLGLQFSLLATLTWGTYLDLRRQQSFSGRRPWAARVLCYVPSLFFMMVIYFQQPTSKSEIYFYLGWIVSALSAVSLLPIFKDSHCIPPDANERRLALPQEYSPWQYSPWRSALRISLKSLIAGLIVYVIIYHLQSAILFQHLKAEQVQQRAFSILSKLQREYDFSFRYDHKLNEILEITLTPATPPDLLSHLPFSTIQRTSVLTISGIQPTTQIPTLNTAQTGLQIVDSRLTIDQLQSILDNCALLGLTRCEIVADAGQVPQVGASGFISSDLPMEFTELAPGNIARVLAANSTSYRGAISIRASKLDQNDLIALLQAPNTLKSYYTSSDDLAILEDTVQQLPTKVRGQSPSLRVNVMGEIDLSPENYPNLWQRALAGDLLLVHATENLSNFYLSGFVQQPSGNLHQPKPLLSFLPEGPNDSGFMFSTAQLREMHWLNPSDDKPENRDKLDTLWLPNVMFLNHIEPELLRSLTKLSVNSRRFGQIYNERWDNERQVSAEKILATLDNLECLEIGGVYSRNTNLASLPNNLKVLESSTDLPLPYDLILSGRRLEKIILTGGPPKGLLQELSKYPKIQFVLLVPRNHAANAKRDLLAFNAPHIKLIVADHTYESLQTSWYQFHQLMIQRVRDRVQAAANSRSSQPPK